MGKLPGKLLHAEVELVHERGNALILTAGRLEALIAELRATPADDGERHARLSAQAAHQLWRLIVQREAIGLWNHDDVYDSYGVPRWLQPSAKPA